MSSLTEAHTFCIEDSGTYVPAGRNGKTRYVLLTKTAWDEAPRLRHQVARLLAKHSGEVHFVEKAQRLKPVTHRSVEPGIEVYGHGELLHHQLRWFPTLSRLNAVYESSQFRRRLSFDDQPVVVNFCYDYYFVRRIFGQSPVITIIYDDFLSAAIYYPEARRVLKATVEASDFTLAVSYSLLEQVQEFTNRCGLFLPWARLPYSRPEPSSPRDALLYWGYLSERVDCRLMESVMDASIPIHFAGPRDKVQAVDNLLAHPNARYHGTQTLASLAPVIAQCAAAILPYVPGFYHHRVLRRIIGSRYTQGYNQAITINNRAFDLLSRGLALLYADLPGLINAPNDVIYKCGPTPEAYITAYRQAQSRFDAAQYDIERFLREHTESVRWEQLNEYMNVASDHARSVRVPL